MKTSSLPSLRVDPELRGAAEAVLHPGESLSGLIEQSLREEISRRRKQAEFIARGLAAREDAQRSGVYYTVDQVMGSLQGILDDTRSNPRP